MSDLPDLVARVRKQLISSDNESSQIVRVLGMRRPIGIDKIYVETKVQNDLTYSRVSDSDSPVRKTESKIPGIDAIRDNPKLIILGKPGSGKTIFLKHIVENSKLNSDLDEIPILVILRDYNHSYKNQEEEKQGERLELDTYIKNVLDQKGIEKKDTQKILDAGKSLILLDGLDEVPNSESDFICGKIIDFIKKYHRNRFVVTCRNASEPFKLEDFVEVQMADFDGDQASNFITNWFRETQELFSHNQERIQLAQERLTRKLNSQSVPNIVSETRRLTDDLRSIKEFTQTPLLLTMLCLVITEQDEIPGGRLELYKKSVDILLKEWDNERGISRIHPDGLTAEKIKILLSKIAIQAHSANETKISGLEIESIIDQDDRTLDPSQVLRFIESKSGILESSGLRDRYSFTHKTFQEYFTALYITQSIEKFGLKSHLKPQRIVDSFWLEVFTLVAEFLCHKRQNINLITDLLSETIQCIISILEKNPSLNNFIKEINSTVSSLTIQDSEEISEPEDRRLISAALRVFLSDPDYRYDSTRTLLLELDKRFGNILVASSFIIRLFYDQNNNDIDISEAIETAMQVPTVGDADNADHALEIVYKYVQNQNYRINRVRLRGGYLQIRSQQIQNNLEAIYNNTNSTLGNKAEECRDLCRTHLELNKQLKLSSVDVDIDLSSYPKLYNATLLLTRSMNIINSLLPYLNLRFDLKNLIMTSSDELNQGFKLITQLNKNENDNERRFAGQLSSEYSLWQLARPHISSLRKNLIRQLLIGFEQQENFAPRILELGCGDGELTKLILDNLGNHKANLVAVDNEPLMIQKIRQRFNSSIDNEVLSVIQEDMLNYLKECDPEHFDFIISGFTFHNMIISYRVNVLQEVYRVLRSGGKLLDADKLAQIGEEHVQAREWQIHKFIEVLAPAQRYDLLEKIILHYMTDEEPNRIRYEDKAIEELQSIGFKDVKLFDRQYMDAIIIALK